jgi:hypothetical protein
MDSLLRRGQCRCSDKLCAGAHAAPFSWCPAPRAMRTDECPLSNYRIDPMFPPKWRGTAVLRLSDSDEGSCDMQCRVVAAG